MWIPSSCATLLASNMQRSESSWWKNSDSRTRDLVRESLFFHQELSDRSMLEAKRVAHELGIHIYLPGLFSSTPELPEDKARYDEKCVEPYKFVYVRAEGTLGPCCVNDSRLGTLHRESFDD